MSNDNSVRSVLSVMFLVAALLVAMNRAVQAAAGLEWGLPLVLFIIGLAIALWGWYERRTSVEQPVTPPTARTAQVQDDLARLEGIGPKMAAALVAAGIDSFDKLAHASEDEIRAAITAGGLRFAPTLPTWPMQAAYAAKGDWEALAAYQKTLVSGRKA
jgi:hypothetical protein